MDELKKIYQDELYNIKKIIIDIIKKSKNNELCVSILQIDLSYEKSWHDYLMNAYWALGGDYPDDESEDYAIMYGMHNINKCIEMLYSIPIDMLEDIVINIDDHITNDRCLLCN